MPPSFGYSAGVFSKSIAAMDGTFHTLPAKACLALGVLVCAACVGPPVTPLPIEKAEVFDTVTGEIYRATETKPLCVPDNAVVVPGSRAITKGKAAEWGLSLYTPVIVKYRDERTDRGVELEDLLR